MRVTGPWLDRPSSKAVCEMLEAAGHQALFVGGCVRNAVLGAPVADLDVATDARPDRVMELAQQAGLKAIPTGIDHGTVTVVADHEPYEITTFRRDVETDGRRAVVTFADHMEDDARRRDFTMNALYARIDGAVLDPLGGLPDLLDRRVRFIGRAQDRIAEDYLRALRFFRFHAWYGDADRGMDPQALDAIARQLDGLEGLSRERVGAESLKLLAAPDPAPAVAAMRATGALMRLLPGADDRALAPLIHMEQITQAPANPLRRLAVLGDEEMFATLRLSRAQMAQTQAMRDYAINTQTAAELGYRLGDRASRDALLIRAALLEQPVTAQNLADAAAGAEAECPVCAQDLIPAYSGANLGNALKLIEKDWIDSGFSLTRDALLSKLGDPQG